MDYEKKYKEALELARVAAFNGHQSLMEGIFPELKESEDEKTRKEIIYHIKNCDDTIDEETEKRMLAWLEKQGEQKPQRMISAKAKEALYDKLDWGKEDESYLNTTIAYLKDAKEFKKTAENCIDWLKKLKQRIGDKL